MTDDRSARAARVRVEALVAAARGLVCDGRGAFAPAEELVARMAAASGLSAPSVRHALEHALEWRATPEDCGALAARAGAPHAGPLVVVLAGNVTTAALRALACAVARAQRVVVYPSSRDPVLAEELVARGAVEGLSVERDRARLPWGDRDARVVLYGGAEAARAVSARAAGPVEVHGPGLGLAVLTDDDDEDAIAALAEDVAAFDQAGCLSPRVAVHVGEPRRGETLAAALHEALARVAATRAIGALPDDTRAARALFVRSGQLVGRAWASDAGAVVHATVGPPAPSPPARALAIRTLPSLAEAAAWLAPLRPLLSAVGAREEPLRAAMFPGDPLRRSALGHMQRPRFDGPVDLRPSAAPHGPTAPKSG